MKASADGPSPRDVDVLCARLEADAEAAGYHLNPDHDFVNGITEGLLVNEVRYGYRACPCRLARGDIRADRDIVCPCDYRDADLADWGSCFCGLYVSADVRRGDRPLAPVPERRAAQRAEAGEVPAGAGRIVVWRCRVCGYLCARERPPSVCPICKATSDRFEAFDVAVGSASAGRGG